MHGYSFDNGLHFCPEKIKGTSVISRTKQLGRNLSVFTSRKGPVNIFRPFQDKLIVLRD